MLTSTRPVWLLAGLCLALLAGCRAEPAHTPEEMYQYALGLEAEGLKKEAGHWFRKAATSGHALAQVDVAIMYRYGDAGVLRDPYEAERWFGALALPRLRTALADFGNPSTYGASGVLRHEGQAQTWFRAAARSLREEARAGNLDAQFYLGSLYAQGAGVPRDPAMTLRLWTEAARRGHAAAQYWLASAHLAHDGFEAAEALLLQAAHQGFAPAQFRLASLYLDPGSPMARPERARYWLRQAAARHYLFAERQLAAMEMAGSG